jgi:hypothetical protein
MQRPKSPLLSHPERHANRSTWFRVLAPVFIGLSLPLALTACPGGAELEDPERFGLGTGATAGAGGASAGTAGTAAGTAGNAGTATAGNGGSAGMVTYVPPQCDWQTPLAAQCARAGCHNASFTAADLDLTLAGVENRLINVNAPHSDITCPNPDGGVLKVPCVPESCPTAKLVDTEVPANSWMLKKIVGTEVGECGMAMPIAPGELLPAEKDCLIQWVNAMAAAQ